MKSFRMENNSGGAVTILLVIAAVVVVLVIVGTGMAQQDRPGSPTVYADIDASTDCVELQKMFDTAWANNRRYPAGTEQFDWSLGYMNAADDRMRDVGCFG